MRRSRILAIAAIALLSLTGCDDAGIQAGEPVQAEASAHAGDRADGSPTGTPQLLPAARTADTWASLIAVAAGGREVTLDHGPLDAIGMGAMTMAFDVAPDLDVDLAGLAPGARLEIRVRQNRDYTYELVAACVAEGSPAGELPGASAAGKDEYSGVTCLPRSAKKGL